MLPILSLSREICMKDGPDHQTDLDHRIDLTTHVVITMIDQGRLTLVREIGGNEELRQGGHQSEHTVLLVDGW